MTTARERVLEIHRAEPDLTATDIGRMVGVSRQRVQAIADQEGIELPRYTRGATSSLIDQGLEARARRSMDALRASLAEARQTERQLTKLVTRLSRRSKE